MRVRLVREGAVLLLYVAVAVATTWPLARLLPIAVSYPGDPLINAHILAWGAHALATPAEAYHSNTFFPAPYALTFSENLMALWPLAAVLLQFTNAIATHNVLLLLGFAFSAYGANILGRVLTGSHASGLIAGLVYGFIPWRFVHLAHVQHAWGVWLPLIVAAFVVYDRRRTRAAAAMLGVALILNGLTNLHYLVFGVAIAAATCVLLAVSSTERRTLRYLTPIVLSIVGACVLLAVVLWPYRIAHQMHGLRGSEEETAIYSVAWSDWVNRPSSPEPERRVFPGFVALALAAIGASCFIRRDGTAPRLWGVVPLVFIVLGMLFSTGLASALYAFLFEHSMVIRGIRAPARWAVVSYVGLAMLAAFAMRGRGRVLAAIVAVVCVAAIHEGPRRWYLMPPSVDPVYEWIADHKPSGGILELPIGARDVYYLTGAALHHQPVVNGASGGVPPVYLHVRELFNRSSIPEDAVATLRRLGVKTIVVHVDALGERAAEVRRWIRAALEQKQIAYAGRFEAGVQGDYVFRVSDQKGVPPDDALESFLNAAGTIPANDRPFGFLGWPLPGAEAGEGLSVRGWALAGPGIRRVRVWFANKSCYVDAPLSRDPELQKYAPHHSTENARFALELTARPCGGTETDVLVELTDHAGRTATLPHVWMRWERRRPGG